jgi:nitrogen fixation protein NifQ
MAQIVAEVALAFNHLWEDLGLDSRAELGRLMSDCFPQLVVQNVTICAGKSSFTASAACNRRGDCLPIAKLRRVPERSLCFEPPPL